jgi:outer membrane protein TolC
VTQVQLNAGVASQFDVLRAQTQLDNNRQALISSRNQVSISKNAFANSLGIDPSTPIDPQPLDAPPVPDLNEEGLIQTAFNQRPEYLQADANVILAQRNIRLARRNLEPFLNAGVSGNYGATSNNFGQDRGTASIGLGLTVPLYDGGATRAQVQSARSEERGALIQKDQFARGIKAEVQQSVIAVRDADERRTAIARTVEQAREALRLANVRFQAGVGTQLDVNDAQTALTQAETNQVNAQYDFLGALARLQRSVGTPQ